MLKENVVTVRHPLFGVIRLNEKFAKVMDLKPFRELGFKSQLGTKVLSKELLNAKHTRLMHSVGVMYLTGKLLDACEKKFSKYFTITPEDRETLELAALGHDIGHTAFSHSLEERGTKTHEERTIEYFEEYAEEINKIFGYDITSKVISIYKNNADVKKQGINKKMEENLDILFIFTSLLIGTIDCDRMEYIMSDRYLTLGEKVDFTNIFSYITIVLLNDNPTVGFERGAIPAIENMLITRFDQYDYIYYEADAILVEMALKMYKKEAKWSDDYITSAMEFEILSELRKTLMTGEKGSILYRLAQVILEGKRDNIFFKKFKNDKQYEHFLKRLYSVTERRDMISIAKKKARIYNPEKNRVYIKDDDGVVKDITEVSLKVKDLSISFSYVMVDIDEVYGLTQKEIDSIKALFEDNPVEIEKKFSFPEELKNFGILKSIRNVLTTMAGIETIGNWNMIKNEDLYYNPTCQIPSGIAMRYRKTKSRDSIKESYYIKIKADDGTSITKREEYEYKNLSSVEEFLELATSLFESKNFKLEEKLTVEKGVKIKTTRVKTLINLQGSIIEISCDFSKYEYKGKTAKGNMLECELKEGDDLSLWYLTKHLEKFGFKQTNESKQKRAKKALEIE